MKQNISELNAVAEDNGQSIAFVCNGEKLAVCSNAVMVAAHGADMSASGYQSVETDEDRLTGTALVELKDGSRVRFCDVWRPKNGRAWQCDRTVTIEKAGEAKGLRFGIEIGSLASPGSSAEDAQFFVPGSLYNRNDNDCDGKEDYLGTLVQDFRDDRLANLSVAAFVPAKRRYMALMRVTPPVSDTTVSHEQMLARQFVQETDVGSLGLTPGTAGDDVVFNASYPFCERTTFCLNTDGDGWAAYLPNIAGRTVSLSYCFCIADAENLTDAIWDITLQQKQALASKPVRLSFDYHESLEWRQLLTQQYYYQWPAEADARMPAGYRVHFSPRTGESRGALLEYGFSGAQTLLAYAAVRDGYAQNTPLWIERARTVNDFFVNHCVEDNGFAHGIYDAEKHDFVHWFTGILLPFQYAEDEDNVRRQLGSQITKALLPVSRELRKVKGNYTRTMCESFYPLLLAYDEERRNGTEQQTWLEAAKRFGRFLIDCQNDDGSWYRAYTQDGTPITAPGAWFGVSDIERKSGTIFPAEVLIELHRLTGDDAYRDAAVRGGDYVIKAMVEPVAYVGGLNDTTHIKSVKVDSVGVMFVMRSLMKIYEAGGGERFLDAAGKAARVLASWVYLWKVPMPAGSLLGEAGFNSTGWAGCDVLPSGSYLDNEFLEFDCDMVRIAAALGDESLFDIAELVHFGMQQALSVPERMLGYAAPGIQCEGIMTAYWMSDPDTAEFSGAVHKVKGDDNDTCNGLTNGQAIYSHYNLMDTYGTSDFATLRKVIFHHDRHQRAYG